MDPNSMTKSQLQSALTGHNISVPASARKSVFVGLYADHVLFRNCNCRSATIRVRDQTNMTTSGFSSDDDIDDYMQPVAVQPKGKPGIIGWLSNVFSGSGDTGPYPQGIQKVPSAIPNNYGNMLSQNNNTIGQQPFYTPINNKRGQKQQFSGAGGTKRGQQQRRGGSKGTKLGQQRGPKNIKRGQQRISSPNKQQPPTNPYMSRGLLSGPNRGLQQQHARNMARSKIDSFAEKTITPAVTVQPEHKWPGPPVPPPRRTNNVFNVFRQLGTPFFKNSNFQNCECLGGRGDGGRGGGGRGRGRGDITGRGSLFSPHSPPVVYPRRGLKPGSPNYACVGRKRKQPPAPAWTPCMLPTSDELNKRIREQQEHIRELNSQGKKRTTNQMASLAFTQEQIEVMSNSELLETLRQHGINCGPIVPSTRLVYQKKLLNILSGGLVPWKQAEDGRQRTESYSDKDDEEEETPDIFDSTDEEDEMTPAKLNIVQTKRGKAVAPERLLASGSLQKSPRRRIVSETSARFSRSDAGSDWSQSRQSSEEMMIAESEKLLRPVKKERRVPIYLQVLIFIFVSVIIYLIIYNLEPVFKHPISRH